MTDPIIFKLTTPIKVHSGEQKTELTLKMPSMKAFVQHGSFFRIVESGPPNDRRTVEEFDFKALLGFVHAASGIEPMILDSMDACDVLPLGYAMIRLIGNRPQTPSP